jgi:rubrerythrin
MRTFDSLSERDILALAISLEEEDERIYADFAEGLRQDFPASAAFLEGMRAEESRHRYRLIELYREKFGDHIPLLRRNDVRGFMHRKPVWLIRPLGLKRVRNQASAMELEIRRFYEKTATRAQDARVRQLLDDLAQEERSHADRAEELEKDKLRPDVKRDEDEANRRLFVLQIVQPGLAGLMDGSVSTLAPVFAAAFATRSSRDAFVVGLAASVGAGISMGFAEALSDDGSLTGRGHPWIRGLICGLMTALGGIGHTLPFLTNSEFQVCDGGCRAGRHHRAGCHLVGQAPLHGDAGALGSPASRIRRSSGLSYGDLDRQFVNMTLSPLRSSALRAVERFFVCQAPSVCSHPPAARDSQLCLESRRVPSAAKRLDQEHGA